MATTLECHFVSWLSTKPADERYDYSDPSACALAQFLRDQGYAERPNVGGRDYGWEDLRSKNAGGISDRLGDALLETPHTFGAILARLSEAA